MTVLFSANRAARFRAWARFFNAMPALALLAILFLLSGCGNHSSGNAGGTAGASVAPSGFVEKTAASGINYLWSIEGKRPLNILQTIGNGCAFLDFDGDGNLDILLVGPKLALYKGDGKGHLTDVTHETGLDTLSGHFLGCAVGDYDNDGFDDLYISGYRTGLLLHNEGGKTFRDVTAQAGIKPQPWGTACAFGETRPGSGRLDLFVCNYAAFDPKTDPQLCPESGIPTSCGPRFYKPIRGVLYVNDGSGHFQDASAVSGVTIAKGRGLGVGFMDYDNLGAPGIVIANDELPGDLFQPKSHSASNVPRYENIGERSGAALDRDGNIHGGMGLDWGDYDNDGKPDLFVATFENETKCLYHNEGGGTFRESGFTVGMAPLIPNVAFGCKFLDYDNDGWLDLAVANGHVQDNIHDIRATSQYRQTSALLHNTGQTPAAFEDVSQTIGSAGFKKPIVGRGLAIGDYDNDGRMDMLIVDSEGAPLLLHNEVDTAGKHFLGLRLEGTKSNRDGYGAVVTVQLPDGRRIVRVCHADGSYLSASDRRVHIGLGTAATVSVLTVRWPSGRMDTFHDVAGDRYIALKEGDTAIH